MRRQALRLLCDPEYLTQSGYAGLYLFSAILEKGLHADTALAVALI